MDPEEDRAVLTRAIEATGLSVGELWLRYFELGGNASGLELDAFLHNALDLPRIERDRLAHAINERFMEMGDDQRVDYMGP